MSLAFDAGPPLAVPARFFLSAPLFGLLAAALLGWTGPEAFSVRWQPLALGITHLLALGVLTMTMLGALYQMLPVLAGVTPRRSRRAAALVHALLAAGSAALGFGLAFGVQPLLGAAGPLLAAAVLAFAVSVWPGRAAGVAAPGDSRHGFAWAALGLGVTVALGLWLLAGHAFPEAVALARRWTDVHAAWALGGWVALLVAVVAWQVVPMFTVSTPYPAWLRRGFAPWLVAALALGSLAAGRGRPRPLLLVAAFAGGGGLLAFAVVTVWLLARRRRRVPDPFVSGWQLGCGALAAAVTAFLAGLVWPQLRADPRFELGLGVLMLAGFALTLVAGMLHKIVAFLVWLHWSAALRSRRRGVAPPNVRDLIPEARIRGQLYAQAAATGLLLLAVVWPVAFARPAAAALALAFAWLGANLAAALRRYRLARLRLEAADAD